MMILNAVGWSVTGMSTRSGGGFSAVSVLAAPSVLAALSVLADSICGTGNVVDSILRYSYSAHPSIWLLLLLLLLLYMFCH
jgi:hypothetical protein